jgi:hypothetical protein
MRRKWIKEVLSWNNYTIKRMRNEVMPPLSKGRNIICGPVLKKKGESAVNALSPWRRR